MFIPRIFIDYGLLLYFFLYIVPFGEFLVFMCFFSLFFFFLCIFCLHLFFYCHSFSPINYLSYREDLIMC